MADSIKIFFSREELQQAEWGLLFFSLYFGNEVRAAQNVLAPRPLALEKRGLSQFLHLEGGMMMMVEPTQGLHCWWLVWDYMR